MKKLLLFLSIFLLINVFSMAQQLRYGVVGGLQSSTLYGSVNQYSVNYSSLLGVNFGGVVEYKLNDNIAFRPQLLLSFKGGSVISSNNLSVNTSLTYIETPIQALYKYQIGNGVLIGGLGPYLGIALGASQGNTTLPIGGTIYDSIKTLDWGLSLSVGYELIEKNIGFNLYFNKGLSNINTISNYNTGYSLTNSTIGLSMMYFFGHNGGSVF